MTKGEDLNVRVWSLFEKSGFRTQPNSKSRTEPKVVLIKGVEKPIDLYAHDPLGASIVVSNKSGGISGFYDHIAGLEDIREAAEANCKLLVATEKEFSNEETRFLEKKGVVLWRERELKYFELLVSAIGSFAKYEIISSLGIRTTEQVEKITVPAIHLRQPNWSSQSTVELYMFSLPADVLLRTCAVLRKARCNAFMYQRILTRKRLPRIGEFVGTAKAMLPTNLVLHLGESVVVEHVSKKMQDTKGRELTLWNKDPHLVTLTIPKEYASLEIIDGQHRLFGFVHAKQKTRENFHLAIIGIKNLSPNDRSKTFVAINDKAKRVDPSLVSFLRYTDSETSCRKSPDLMAIKVVVELNKRDPFKNAIRLWDYGPQKITLKGFSGYDLKGMVGPTGIFQRYYPNASAVYVGVLRMYFSTLRDILKPGWDHPDTYILATNRGVTAFLKLLKSIHKNEQKRLDPKTARKYLTIVRDHWIKRTWETSKLDTSYSASQGWKQFHRDLIRSVQKKIRTFRE
jgi:DGQHR domain-containing protein